MRVFITEQQCTDLLAAGGKAGLNYEFKIITKDLFENPVTAGEDRWDNAFIVKFDSGLTLRLVLVPIMFLSDDLVRWGTLTDNKDGTFKVMFTIDVAGTYLCHIMFRDTNSTYVTLKGTPFETIIIAGSDTHFGKSFSHCLCV